MLWQVLRDWATRPRGCTSPWTWGSSAPARWPPAGPWPSAWAVPCTCWISRTWPASPWTRWSGQPAGVLLGLRHLKRHFSTGPAWSWATTPSPAGTTWTTSRPAPGNLIPATTRHMERQWPVLAGRAEDAGLPWPARSSPLPAGRQRDQGYALSLGLPAAYGKCPRSGGPPCLSTRRPGTPGPAHARHQRDLYLAFLREKGAPPLEETPPGRCPSCGSPTYVGVCSACRLLAKARLAREEGRA